MPMTPKQQAFVEAYLGDAKFNATKAAELAGYSKKTARAIGAENLTKPDIQAAIAAAQARRAAQSDLSAHRVLEELRAIAFSDLADLLQFGPDGVQFLPPAAVLPAARRAVASIKMRRTAGEDAAEICEVRLWDKVSALRTLAEHLGLVNELQALLAKIAELEHAQDGGANAGGSAAAPGRGGAVQDEKRQGS